MKRILVPGLALYTLLSGWGLFLGPEPAPLLLAFWLAGFVFLALLTAYHAFFSIVRTSPFPFIVLGIILLNFIHQIAGGERSFLWPLYFLFTVLVAAFSPLWQAAATPLLILAIEAANLHRSGFWSPERWPVYAGFAASLLALSIAIASILRRQRGEAERVRDAHEKLIAHADALDPLADGHTLDSLAGRKTAAVRAAKERETTFDGLIDMISRFVPAHTYALFLNEKRDERSVFVLRAVRSQATGAVLPMGTELEPDRIKTLVDSCIELKQRQYVPDASGWGNDPARFGYYAPNARGVPVRSFFALPVMQDEQVIGVVAVDSLEPGAFSLEDQDTLGYFEPFFIQIIEKIQMALTLKVRADHFGSLHEISTLLISSLRFDEIMEQVVPRIRKAVPYDFCACVLRTEREGVSRLKFSAIEGFGADLRGKDFPFGESAVVSSMVKHWQDGVNATYYSADLGTRGRDIGLFPFKEFQKPIRSLYGKLMIANNDCLGAFFVASLGPDAFPAQLRSDLLDTLVNQISLVAHNSRLYRQIEDLARTDGLTGLLNHRTFMGKLAEEYRRLDRDPRPFSILLMDIDKFKSVNDTYGHPVGDQAIKAVAQVLRETARASDFVARYGGEEFAVGMVETDVKGALQMAERVRAAMEKTVVTRVGGKDLLVTLSIGVCTYPRDTDNKADLVALADNALYLAKQSGRNRVRSHKDVLDAAQTSTNDKSTGR